ncbi:MAG: CoA transferase [Chloroflexi bacterium]|nr:CoA transferase [Chloroflexota bacterium]
MGADRAANEAQAYQKLPLEGIKVLELAQFYAGPMGAAYLRDFGAEVIKVEDPKFVDPQRKYVNWRGIQIPERDGRILWFEEMHKGKRSIALSLDTEKGKGIFRRLVEHSDVFITNNRRRTLERLGVDYASLRAINPRLVYVRVTGYGPEGSDRDKPAFDMAAQARAGLMMYLTRDHKNDDPFMAYMMGDEAGAIATAWGATMGIMARERHGVGQLVDTSLLGGVLSFFRSPFFFALTTGRELETRKRSGGTTVPLSNVYKCADGLWLVMTAGAILPVYWPRLCTAIGKPDLENDVRFSTAEARRRNNAELIKLLDEVFVQKNRDEWLETLAEYELPASKVNTVVEATNDAQVETNFVRAMEHPVFGKVRLPSGVPFRMSNVKAISTFEAPALGQHSEEILEEVGYSRSDIAACVEDGTVVNGKGS